MNLAIKLDTLSTVNNEDPHECDWMHVNWKSTIKIYAGWKWKFNKKFYGWIEHKNPSYFVVFSGH